MPRNHPIPPSALDKHIVILGKTGSGKSNTAKTIAEALLALGRRVCVIDPTGTWWGLRLKADGATPSGYPIVIFGGQHADLPVGPNHGTAIAQTIGTTSTPAIIDTRLMTVADRTRFFTSFAETLIRANRGELTLIIDESHLFAPQAGARVGGGAPAMLHAANNLVSLGRGVGLRIILISQRPAKLHKDSLTQVETLVAMRLIAPQDRKAIDEWIGEWADAHQGGGLVASLPSLATGDAWVWSPEIGHLERTHCPLAATYDSGHVRVAGHLELPQIDVSAIEAQLEEVGADMLGDDPKRLKRRVAELERELAKKSAGVVDEAEVERRIEAAVAAVHERYGELIGDAVTSITGQMREGIDLLKKLRDRRMEIETGAEPESPNRPQNMQNLCRPTRAEPVSTPPKASSKGAESSSSRPDSSSKGHQALSGPAADRGLTGPQQRILDALAWLADIGIAERASRVQVAFLAGYKPKGGAFNNTLSSLRTAGLIDYPSSGEVTLTTDGGACAVRLDLPATDEALQRMVMDKLTGPQRRVLQPLIDAWPDHMGTDDLAEKAGYEAGGGAFNNTRSSLRSLGLIDYPASGRAVALPVLFVGASE